VLTAIKAIGALQGGTGSANERAQACAIRQSARGDRVTCDDAVRLQVTVNGRRFRTDEATRTNGNGERVGLSSMRERLLLLGRRFELQSEPRSSLPSVQIGVLLGALVGIHKSREREDASEVEVPTNREDYDDAE